MNGLDGISAELISATRVALERQLHEAEERLRHTEQAIEEYRRHEAWALLQTCGESDSGQGVVSTGSIENGASGIEYLAEDEPLKLEKLLEELAAARVEAYWCRRAITELNRAIAVLGTVTI